MDGRYFPDENEPKYVSYTTLFRVHLIIPTYNVGIVRITSEFNKKIVHHV